MQLIRLSMVIGLVLLGAGGLPSTAAALTLNEAQTLLGKPGSSFGYSIAMSDKTAVIGAVSEGAAYVYTRDGGSWTRQARLVPEPLPSDIDFFGFSVALSGNTAVVGAPLEDGGGFFDAGAAYIFTRDSSGNWTQRAKLVASDSAEMDFFGDSVSVSGDTAVVGAWGDDNDAGTGAAYVFRRDYTGVWAESAKLLNPGGPVSGFGESVAVDGDTILIGARDVPAYVFTRKGHRWSEQARLTAPDAALSLFGVSVALDQNTALIGAPTSDVNGSNSGAAYVFARNRKGSWTEEGKLVSSDGAPGDFFGVKVVVAGDTAVIGAHNADDLGESSGAAYVFTRHGGEWTEHAKLLPSDGAAGDSFGFGVAATASTAIIGAPSHDGDGMNSGSAYVFALTLTPQQQLATLVDATQGLVDTHKLPRGLLATLRAAEISLDQGYTRSAINQIAAFIRQVEATVRSRRLSEEEAAPVLAVANQLSETLKIK